jgi:ParB-like chromosome segregation protein Spo0J
VTDLQAIIISLIENVQRKDLTLAERVETYQLLRQLDAEYQNHHNLAKATGFSHQKISQDFQADEIRLKLEPHGIRVASHLPVSADERQESKVLPEYHAVLLHQAMAYLETEQQLVVLAEKIAAMSQAAAKDYIEAVKEGRVSPDAPENQLVEGPSFDLKQSSHRHTASRHRKVTTKQQAEESSIPPQQETAYPQDVPSGYQEEVTEEADGGVVTCAFCKHQLTLSHLSNGTHQLIPQAIHPPENQMALPGLDS